MFPNVILTILFGSNAIFGVVDGVLICVGLWGLFNQCGVKPQ